MLLNKLLHECCWNVVEHVYYLQTKSSLVEPSRTTQPELSTTSRQPIRRRSESHCSYLIITSHVIQLYHNISFFADKRACKDKGKSDCQFWASQKFCKHPSPEFRKWMETNCRLSCGLCKQKKQKRECVDQRWNDYKI